jgi:hypothetical protein
MCPLLGLEARAQAQALRQQALAALARSGLPTPRLCAHWPTWWSTGTT